MKSRYKPQLLAVLARTSHPLSVEQMQAAMPCSPSALYHLLHGMALTGEAHRAAKDGGQFLWKAGPGDGVVVKKQQMRRTSTYSRVKSAVESHPGFTTAELAALLRIGDTTATQHLRTMRLEKVVYISGWQGHGQQAAARFTVGNLPDALRPAALKVVKRVVEGPKVVLPEVAKVDLSGMRFRSVIVPGAPWPYAR